LSEKWSSDAGETEQPSLHLAPTAATRIGAANPNSGERDFMRHVSGCYWTVNTGQLVKANSQLWSKVQKWLNKRGRIGNWTEIKLIIN